MVVRTILLFFLLSVFHGFTEGGNHGKRLSSNVALAASLKPMDILKRAKRQTEDECIQECVTDFKRDVEEYLPEMNKIAEQFQTDPFSVSTLDQNQFYVFCNKIYTPMDKCVNTCDDSRTRQLTLVSLGSLEFMCKDYYNEIHNSIPCLTAVRNETTGVCLNKLCVRRRNATKNLLDASSDVKQTHSTEELKGLMAENCKLVSCLLPCEQKILKYRCGAETARLMKSFSQISMLTVRRMYELMDMTYMWPNECNIK